MRAGWTVLGCATILLLAAPSRAQLPLDPKLVWQDEFKEQQRAIAGKSEPGLLLEGTSGKMRPQQLGAFCRMILDVKLPEGLGNGRGLLLLVHSTRIDAINIKLHLDETGDVILSVNSEKHLVASKPTKADSEKVWRVEAEVNHGVIRARAAPVEQKTPAQWQVIDYCGVPSFEPERLMLLPVRGGKALLQRIEVHSVPPRFVIQFDSAKQREAADSAMFQLWMSEKLATRGSYDKAETYLNKAKELIDKNLDRDHPMAAHLNYYLGYVRSMQGRYAEAQELFEQSLAVFSITMQRDDPDIARARDALALVYLQQGKFDAAEKLAVAAMKERRRILGDQHPEYAVSLNTMCNLRTQQGDLKDAESLATAGLKIRRAVLTDRHPDTGRMANNLAVIKVFLAEYEEAAKLLQQATATYKATYGSEKHLDVATVFANRGFLERCRGNLADADADLGRALELQESVVGKKHPARVQILNNRGIVASEQGDDASAQKYWEEALELARELLGPDHPSTALVELNLGSMLLLQNAQRSGELLGRATATLTNTKRYTLNGLEALHTLAELQRIAGNFKTADSVLANAIVQTREQFGPEHPLLASLLASHAQVKFALDDRPEAHRLMQSAVYLYETKLGPRHPRLALALSDQALLQAADQQPAAAERNLRKAVQVYQGAYRRPHALLADAHFNLGLVLQQKGDSTGAAESFKQACRVDRSLSRLLSQRSQERLQLAYSQLIQPHLDKLLSHCSGLEQFEPMVEEIFGLALDFKMSATLAQQDRLEMLLSNDNPAGRQKLLEYRTAQEELLQALVKKPRGLAGVALEAKLEGLATRSDRLERELAETVQGFSAARQQKQASMAQIAAAMPPDAGHLEFVRYTDLAVTPKGVVEVADSARYGAFLLLPGPDGQPKVSWIALGDAAELEELVRRWRGTIGQRVGDAEQDRLLFEKLWKPIAVHLPPQVKRLSLAPAGELGLVPFAALRAGDQPGSPFLLEKYELLYVDQARGLVPRPVLNRQPTACVVLADPNYDWVGAGEPAGQAARSPRGLADFKSLPGFRTEADDAEKTLATARPAELTMLRRERASEEALRKVLPVRLLHVITHGYFLPPSEKLQRHLPPSTAVDAPEQGMLSLYTLGEDPRLRSGVALAGANRYQERLGKGLSDGLLSAYEVQNMDFWGTELVILSACDTGRGFIQNGEGVLGIRRAFHLAGARNVVASLWKVPDTETAKLMSRFVKNWAGGMPKAQALREAQLELLKELRASSDPARQAGAPLYWAAFGVFGPWELAKTR